MVIQNLKKEKSLCFNWITKRTLDRCIKTDKNKYKSVGNCSLNEQVNNIEIDENENRE